MAQKWRFSEPKNRGVFTTKGLLESRQLILFVIHDENDDWQFLGDEEPTDDNCSVVGLEEVVHYDPSVADIAHLPRGCYAYRSAKQDKWQTRNSE